MTSRTRQKPKTVTLAFSDSIFKASAEHKYRGASVVLVRLSPLTLGGARPLVASAGNWTPRAEDRCCYRPPLLEKIRGHNIWVSCVD